MSHCQRRLRRRFNYLGVVGGKIHNWVEALMNFVFTPMVSRDAFKTFG